MNLHRFARSQRGFTGAEKALLICFGLAIVLLLGSLLRSGSQQASQDAARVLASGTGSVGAMGTTVDLPHAGDGSAAPAIAPPPATAPPAAKPSAPGLLGQVGGFFTGVYDGGKDMVVGLGGMAKGAWNLTGGWITDPAAAHQTLDHLGTTVSTVVQHPGQVLDAITKPYTTAWSQGRYGEAIGRGTFEVASLVLGTKGLDQVAEASKVAEAGSDLEKLSTLDHATLAARAGDSLAQQAARKSVAQDFYANQAGWAPDRIADHVGGIDLSKPVQVVPLPSGTLDQWVGANGRVGNYFAPPGTQATELGINPAGRTVQSFQMPPGGGEGLQSTAAPILDTWTDAAHPYQAQGGGTQIFVTDAQRDAIKAYNQRP